MTTKEQQDFLTIFRAIYTTLDDTISLTRKIESAKLMCGAAITTLELKQVISADV